MTEVAEPSPPLSYREQLDLLKRRGLQVPDDAFAESNEEFASHYKAKHCHRPEIWVAIELLEFGKFCSFYNNTKQVKIRERIASHFNLNEPTFASLINTARHLRNICAHHSRLWNRKLTAKITPPKKHPAELIENVQHFPPSEDDQSRRIYNPLVLLIHCIRIIQPDSDWPKRLHNLLRTLPAELLPEMGFPKDWQQRPIWR